MNRSNKWPEMPFTFNIDQGRILSLSLYYKIKGTKEVSAGLYLLKYAQVYVHLPTNPH